ncbi:MAG: 3-deoxy-8-phosphooctulonate synthase [Deltaproteobacteria bacterium]|nr:3-deoxy-8-phosphooctulonate synthase [Deltaproteobacteria bacterium]MBI3388079.1 3-deoxy-8-phosphooctulonate synthase [Deltaproteobacteria bacterium]
MPAREVIVGSVRIGGAQPLAYLGGPCVIESRDSALRHAAAIKAMTDKLGMPFVFKSSFDKANRTSLSSYRGPGLHEGLKILAEVKREIGVAVVTDVHETPQIAAVAEVADLLQTPAFLCRQTDFLLAVARAGKPMNIKKGQFLAPWDIGPLLEKVASSGNQQLIITERGASFGYNNLVADMRSLAVMAEHGYPVVYDAGHSVQLPGGQGAASGGQRQFIRPLARAAVAVGVNAVFLETHEDPDRALSDGPNSYRLSELPALLRELQAIHSTLATFGRSDASTT